MSFTGTNVITDEARVILDDTVVDGSTERWSNATLLRYLNAGGRLIGDLRPDALLSDFYTITAWTDVAAIGDTVPLPDRYREPLVDFVCSKALAEEGQDTHDLTRSNAHFQQFVIKAGLPPNLTTQGRRG